MTCDNCKFANTVKNDGAIMGLECRRNPPTLIVMPVQNSITREVSAQPATAFPVVRADNWCGEFQKGGNNVLPTG